MKLQVGAVVGEAESGAHGKGRCGGEEALRQTQHHAAPCPWAPHYALHRTPASSWARLCSAERCEVKKPIDGEESWLAGRAESVAVALAKCRVGWER